MPSLWQSHFVADAVTLEGNFRRIITTMCDLLGATRSITYFLLQPRLYLIAMRFATIPCPHPVFFAITDTKLTRFCFILRFRSKTSVLKRTPSHRSAHLPTSAGRIGTECSLRLRRNILIPMSAWYVVFPFVVAFKAASTNVLLFICSSSAVRQCSPRLCTRCQTSTRARRAPSSSSEKVRSP